jgi:hypothetical protein
LIRKVILHHLGDQGQTQVEEVLRIESLFVLFLDLQNEVFFRLKIGDLLTLVKAVRHILII